MNITSIFENRAEIPEKYTCLGININPPLHFHEVPLNTKSLVLILEDIDAAPAWTHWHVYDISPDTISISEGQFPHRAKDGLCNNHTLGYEGPCPKYFKGRHEYLFSLYALDERPTFNKHPEPDEMLATIKGSIIEKAELRFYCSAPSY